MDCRAGCGACCIAPSIASPIPGMPGGKPAGVVCVQLAEDHLCALFGSPERPAACAAFRATEEFCGGSRDQAMALLAWLERETGPETSCDAPCD